MRIIFDTQPVPPVIVGSIDRGFAIDAAGDQMMDIEKLSDEELDVLQSRYETIRAECMERNKRSNVGKKEVKA